MTPRRRSSGAASMILLGAAAFAGAMMSEPVAAQTRVEVWPYERPLRPVLYAGLSGGGDTLATVRFTDGTTQSVNAGGLVQISAGLLWVPGVTPYQLQATVGYQVDRVGARNGDVRFTRYPVEVIGYYTGVPNWRFGVGARFVNSPRLSANVGGSDEVRFKDTNGGLLEVGWQAARNLWVNGRVVSERYEVSSVNGTTVVPSGKTQGNAVGVNLVVAF